MIRPYKSRAKPQRTASPKAKPARNWQLQDAKAKFSQVFDLALTSGPQRVTRRARDAVVMISEADYEKLRNPKGAPSLIEALMACPYPLEIPGRDKNDRVGFGDKPIFE